MLKLSHWQSRKLGRPPSEEGWLCWALWLCLPFLGVLLAHPVPPPPHGPGSRGPGHPHAQLSQTPCPVFSP